MRVWKTCWGARGDFWAPALLSRHESPPSAAPQSFPPPSPLLTGWHSLTKSLSLSCFLSAELKCPVWATSSPVWPVSDRPLMLTGSETQLPAPVSQNFGVASFHWPNVVKLYGKVSKAIHIKGSIPNCPCSNPQLPECFTQFWSSTK